MNGELVKITFVKVENMQNDSATAGYTYDGNGLRQSKNVNGRTTAYVYDGVNIIKEGDTYYSRGAAGLISANGNYYYTDYHGSVVRYGNSVYSYDAFGNEKTENTSDSNPFRYCGEYADSESGLVYLRARYYDSVIGAFISEDPIKSGTNWYVYANNNPVSYIDPLGLYTLRYDTDGNVYAIIDLDDGDTLYKIAQSEVGDGNAWKKMGYKGDPGYLYNGEEVNITGIYNSSYPNPNPIAKVYNSPILAKPYLSQEDYNAGVRLKLINGVWYYDVSIAVSSAVWKARPIFESHFMDTDWFGKKVGNGGEWDIKLKHIWEKTIGTTYPCGKVLLFDEFVSTEYIGNMTYGYLGLAAGFTEGMLLLGSMKNHYDTHGNKNWYDEGQDHIPIRRGFDWFKGVGK